MKTGRWVFVVAVSVSALLAQEEAVSKATQLIAEDRYVEAEEVLLSALREAEKAGPGTADVGAIANNLACVYIRLGRNREAERLARQSLAIAERLFGESDPKLALELNTLAGAYYRQGLYSKAEPLFHRALEIAVRAFGPDHPETLTRTSSGIADPVIA